MSIVLLRKAHSGKDLSKQESENYVNSASAFELMKSLYTGPAYKALSQVPLDLGADLKKIRATKDFDSELAKASGWDAQGAAAKVSQICVEQLVKSMALNTSPLRIRQIDLWVSTIKVAAKRVVARLADQNQLESFYRVIDQATFAMPESNQERIDGLRALFESQDREIERTKRMAQMNRADRIQMFLNLAVMVDQASAVAPEGMTETPEEMEFETLEDIKKGCEQLPQSSLSDYALSSLGKISVSWFTANYPEVGVPVMAHELGHVINAEFRRQQMLGAPHTAFSNSLTCVANRNPFTVSPVMLSKNNDTQWSSEDWADHFSALVLNELDRRAVPLQNFSNKGCALVSDFGDTYWEPTLDPAKDDPHSSGFLRLLMIDVDRGKTTAKCKKFLSYADTAGRTLQCH